MIEQMNKKQTTLIQDYTDEQWQTIIDGNFLCEFSDENEFETCTIGYLMYMGDLSHKERFNNGGEYFMHCRPLRTKGVRQPWFGGGASDKFLCIGGCHVC